MRKFFRKTEGFWILSRLLLILLFLASLIFTYFQIGLDLPTFFVYAFMAIYIALMSDIFFRRITDKPVRPYVKIFTGGFSILYGCIAIYTTSRLAVEYDGFMFGWLLMLSVWFILFGIGDLLFHKTNKLTADQAQ